MLRRLCAGFLILAALAALILAGLWLSRHWWLAELGAYLVVDQPPERSGAIVAVSGSQERRQWAIELYRRGYADRLIFNVSDTTYYFGMPIDPVESIMQMASAAGIPRDSLLINPGISSTWEDARATRETVLKLGLRSILVVSSPFNMRRVCLTYKHRLGDLPLKMTFCSVPFEREKLSPESWWSRERELQMVVDEYIKIVFYEFKYFH